VIQAAYDVLSESKAIVFVELVKNAVGPGVATTRKAILRCEFSDHHGKQA
jgi:hypothetical protein